MSEKRYRVIDGPLSIRESANGQRTRQMLATGTNLRISDEVVMAGGYLWAHHADGWSAIQSADGSQVFMEALLETAPASAWNLPNRWQGMTRLQVADDVQVRLYPAIGTKGLIVGTVRRGHILQCDMDHLMDADGYLWAQHAKGWSVVKSLNERATFLVEPGSIAGLDVPTTIETQKGDSQHNLPDFRRLFTRLPVTLTDTQWFQYFGNNMFAMRNGNHYGYDHYSQGLHGGLDFGNSISPKTIYAGLDAEFVQIQHASRNNTRMLFKRGDYDIIYQHVTNPRSFTRGEHVHPDTPIASIEHHTINNGWDHLHLEVRYKKQWIVNPLLLFRPSLYQALIARFDPDKLNSGYQKDFPKSLKNYFYHTATWTKWITPLDQPLIKLGGKMIGPRGELARSDW